MEHQLLVSADHVNTLGENINKEIHGSSLLEASKEFGLETNAEKIRYVFMICH